jgi:vacuolar-type H+-ATPase subunit H
MMSQFIHIEAVSKKGRELYRINKNGKKIITGSISINSVIGEAERIIEFSKHVDNPQKPHIVYGYTDGFNKLRKMLQEWYDETRDSRGHKVRQDANSLLSGTASYIFKEENLTHEEHFQNVLKYEKNLINALKQEYKNDLFLVVRHDDERFKGVYGNIEDNEEQKGNEDDQTIAGEIHYHWHFFCLKEPGEKFDLHPGILEREKYNVSRKEKKELTADELKKRYYDGRKAYRVAMVAYQDKMYNLTNAQEYGISRYGERRIRRSRKEQKDLENYNDKIIQKAHNKAEKIILKAEKDAKANSAEIIRNTNLQANEIKKQAKKEAQETKDKALKDAEDIKNNAKANSAKIIKNANLQAEEIIKQAEKDARKTKDEAWKVAKDIENAAKVRATEIIEKSKKFIDMLLEKIAKLPGSREIIKWVNTFRKDSLPYNKNERTVNNGRKEKSHVSRLG